MLDEDARIRYPEAGRWAQCGVSLPRAGRRSSLCSATARRDGRARAGALSRQRQGSADGELCRIVAGYLGVPEIYLSRAVEAAEIDDELSLLRLRRRVRDYGVEPNGAFLCRRERARQSSAAPARTRQALRDDDRRILTMLLAVTQERTDDEGVPAAGPVDEPGCEDHRESAPARGEAGGQSRDVCSRAIVGLDRS